MTAEKFIELVEEIANIDNLYDNVEEHPAVYEKDVKEAITEAFKTAKKILLLFPET